MASSGRGAALLLVLAVVAGGCSDRVESVSSAADDATVPAASPTASAPAVAVSPGPEPPPPAAEPPPPAPEPAALEVPAARSGPLDAGAVPAPQALGPGWAAWVDPGDVTEGYLGNESFVRERGAAEVTQALVPLGCAGVTSAPRLPAPAYALEATYRHLDGRAAVALVLEHPDATGAGELYAALVDALGRCPAAAPETDSPDAPYRLVVEVEQAGADVFTGTRRDTDLGASGTRWSQVVVLEGARVGVLVLQLPDGGAAATSTGPLAGAVRSALAST